MTAHLRLRPLNSDKVDILTFFLVWTVFSVLKMITGNATTVLEIFGERIEIQNFISNYQISIHFFCNVTAAKIIPIFEKVLRRNFKDNYLLAYKKKIVSLVPSVILSITLQSLMPFGQPGMARQ